jgi:hypothetical protein
MQSGSRRIGVALRVRPPCLHGCEARAIKGASLQLVVLPGARYRMGGRAHRTTTRRAGA